MTEDKELKPSAPVTFGDNRDASLGKGIHPRPVSFEEVVAITHRAYHEGTRLFPVAGCDRCDELVKARDAVR